MPVTPDLDQKPQAAYVTAASVPSQYPAAPALIWTSFERLRDELPEGETIRQRADGAWERPVVVSTGESVIQDGVLQVVKRRVWRRVALSLKEARTLSGSVEEADFWAGWCWIRRGQKPERDWAVITATQAPEDDGDGLFFEPAPPADQMAASAMIAQQTAALGQRLVAPSAVTTTKKET